MIVGPLIRKAIFSLYTFAVDLDTWVTTLTFDPRSRLSYLVSATTPGPPSTVHHHCADNLSILDFGFSSSIGRQELFSSSFTNLGAEFISAGPINHHDRDIPPPVDTAKYSRRSSYDEPHLPFDSRSFFGLQNLRSLRHKHRGSFAEPTSTPTDVRTCFNTSCHTEMR